MLLYGAIDCGAPSPLSLALRRTRKQELIGAHLFLASIPTDLKEYEHTGQKLK
jgi:hypothetical protein